VTRTAVDNVGHSTTASCTTLVGATRVIAGTVRRGLQVNSGEVVEITSSATLGGTVKVTSGGSLDVEGATLTHALTASGAAFIRLCGATVSGSMKVSSSTGPVTLGEGDLECPGNAFSKGVTLKGNTAGVSVLENQFDSTLSVTSGGGGTVVTANNVKGRLTVTGNSGAVTDRPNTVGGRLKLQ